MGCDSENTANEGSIVELTTAPGGGTCGIEGRNRRIREDIIPAKGIISSETLSITFPSGGEWEDGNKG